MVALVWPAQPVQAQSLDATRTAARKALQTNPEVTARLNAYLSKVEAQTAAKGAWLPRVDLNAEAAATRTQNRGAEVQTLNHGGAALTLTQVLWDGLATRNEVHRAGHERLNRWFEFVDASEQTALEATRAAYDLQRMRKLVALAEDNLRQHQEAATKLESRLRAGVGRGVDVDQARARLALAESNRDTELSNLHDVAARYQRIVGELPPADMGGAELLRTGLPSSSTEAVKVALQRSAAVAAGVEAMRAARASEASRKSALQPQLSARASVGGGKNYNAVDGRKSDASVGLQLNWNLFNGGADTARVREQQLIVKQAMDQRDKACRDVRQTVLIAFNDANKLTNQLNTLGRNSAAIERARDAYRQQFDIGQRSLLDLLNAENEAYTARRALTNAVYDRAVAYARTLAAMSQLNTQLGLARELPASEAGDWAAGGDVAERCGAEAVDVTPLVVGADSSVPGDPVAAAAPALAQPVVAGAPPAAVAAVSPLPPATVGSPAARAPLRTAGTAVALTAATVAMAKPGGKMTAEPALGTLAAAQSTTQVAAKTPQPPLPAARDAAETPSAMLARLRAERQTGTDTASQAAQAALETRVQAWAQAWRLRDANELSSYYAPDFRGASASSTAWNAQLRRQLAGAKAQTDVEIEDLVTRDLGDGAVETRFLRTASTADGLDTTSVSLVWRQVNGQWRIVRERKT